MPPETDRRCFLGKGLLGAVGAAYSSIEENILQAAVQDGTASAGPAGKPKSDIQPANMPRGKIGALSISRLIIGGNLIGGFAHSRDLMYVSKLFKAYNTEAKIFETLDIAQACGINTIQVNEHNWSAVIKYNQQRATKLQIVANTPLLTDKTEMTEFIKRLVDVGVAGLYSHGGRTDEHMMNGGRIDAIGQLLDLIKAQGVLAGVGCHSLEVPMACEKNKLPVDFYMKTFHMDRYWSATPKERRKEYDWMRGNSDHEANNDSMWCNNPEETAAFMAQVDKPWIAFKVMAAGAIPPRMAFPYVFRRGADFIVAGMFDFQVEEDAKIAIESIQKVGSRTRPWRA